MLKNYFTTALRGLRTNKVHSFINIAGLSVGMAVAMLIGLWIWDELSFDKYHQHYDRIARVMQQKILNGVIGTGAPIPIPLEEEMRKSYGGDLEHIVMCSWTDYHILAVGDKKISYTGTFIGAEAPEMFTLNMLKGTRSGLKDLSSILLSRSVARALFGDANPIGKPVKMDNNNSFTVTGVYEDLPRNTTFHDITFMLPWEYYKQNSLSKRILSDWSDDSWMMYVQMAPHADMAKVSAKIKNAKLDNAGPALAKFKPRLFLQPMSRWRLYSQFKNGVNTGGAIQYVWLFGIIGMFVLLLACINFMNLSTARSEKRAKEVGIRKAIGSLRGQLIIQFFCESLLMAIVAFAFSMLLASLILPFFNEMADKKIAVPWSNPLFWMISAGFTLFTGLIAGSYPALYLSSFQPVKVLKGTFRAGRFAAIPRKALVVLQFTVSVVLIIGTIIVFKQIQFAKNRPVGYSRDGLVNIAMTNNDLNEHFNAVRTDLLRSGAIMEVSQSSSPATAVDNNRSGVEWKGKDPDMTDDFANIRVTSEYGKSVGWQVMQGRDFSARFLTDSSAVILNETAVTYMGLKHPVGEILRWGNKDHYVIGVVKDMLMSSPYEPVKQTIFYITNSGFGYLNIKIDPDASTREAINKIAAVCKTYSPSVPFSYRFADEEYAKKFSNEERIGKLASFFAILAVFISCLGLFGMATFMAEQRIREIGVRKVLGASVFNLWSQMSKDFVLLVVVSLFIAIPLAYYFMGNWLLHFEYRSDMPWWAFAAAGMGAILITLLTVSYQSIRAALMNPVKSLRAE
ncbi:MAG TPA: ABC transporter permease [Puia sp.]|nr:ABC transporter permease [Puia sp.]